MLVSVLQSMVNRFRAFRQDDEGAVTVDFIILTSSVVMLGIAHANDVARASLEIADDIDACLETDIGNIVVAGDPDQYVANLQAAAAACSSR